MDNLIGRTLDGLYAVRELIGTGGMANVYKAVVVGANEQRYLGLLAFGKDLFRLFFHEISVDVIDRKI